MNTPQRISAIGRALWRQRRWAYGLYMLIAVLRIPARVGFRLVQPHCDMQLTLLNARLSMSKVPHLVLFALFFLVTLVQYDRVSAQSVRVALLVTLALGLLVELEEGASRTGNCRLTDVLPDVAGAAMAGILVVGLIALWRRNAAPGTSSPRTLSNRADR